MTWCLLVDTLSRKLRTAGGSPAAVTTAGRMFIMAAFATQLSWPCAAKKDEGKPVSFEVAGTVTDEQKVPVKGALVILSARDENTSFQTKTDKRGKFVLSHPPSGHQMLRVIPVLKSGLAQAVLTDIPGDEGRHVLISVRKGFVIGGKVRFNQQPLRNVLVRVKPNDDDVVHGGGETQTDGKGMFQLVLTPGHKYVEVTGITDAQLVGSYKQKYNVSGDATMPDIVVPASRAGK